MNRNKRYKLTDYCNNYRKYINDSDKEVFTVKRKTLQNICLLSLELLDDYVNLKRDFEDCSYQNSCNKERLKTYLNLVHDKSYKNSILREYFYRCNRAMDYINKNQNKDLSVDSYYKLKDIIEIDDIANILRGAEDEKTKEN